MRNSVSPAVPPPVSPNSLTPLLRVGDAAKLLSISVWMLRQLAYKKEIVSVKIGKLLMFRREDIEHFVERNRVL
jgi:excisionase family DNA binding protein